MEIWNSSCVDNLKHSMQTDSFFVAVCLRKEFIAGFLECIKGFIVFAIQNFFLEKRPIAFNQIQV